MNLRKNFVFNGLAEILKYIYGKHFGLTLRKNSTQVSLCAEVLLMAPKTTIKTVKFHCIFWRIYTLNWLVGLTRHVRTNGLVGPNKIMAHDTSINHCLPSGGLGMDSKTTIIYAYENSILSIFQYRFGRQVGPNYPCNRTLSKLAAGYTISLFWISSLISSIRFF